MRIEHVAIWTRDLDWSYFSDDNTALWRYGGDSLRQESLEDGAV